MQGLIRAQYSTRWQCPEQFSLNKRSLSKSTRYNLPSPVVPALKLLHVWVWVPNAISQMASATLVFGMSVPEPGHCVQNMQLQKKNSKDNCLFHRSTAGFQIGLCRSLDITGLDLGVFSGRVHRDPRSTHEPQRDHRLLQ